MAELHEKLETIREKEDLVAFIDSLIADYESNVSEWENADLLSFLQAMSAWVGSMEYAYKNTGREFPANPTWDMFGRILYAAKIYE